MRRSSSTEKILSIFQGPQRGDFLNQFFFEIIFQTPLILKVDIVEKEEENDFIDEFLKPVGQVTSTISGIESWLMFNFR